MVSIGSRLMCSLSGLPRSGTGRGIESRDRAFPETPPLIGNPALRLRADTAAAVFNDEEKRARTTTQVHKVHRQG
jgi:hypothetical protein